MSFAIPPLSVALSTPRLAIDSTRGGDAAALAAYYARNREHLSPWQPPMPEEAATHDHWLKRLERFDDEHAQGRALHTVLRSRTDPKGPIIGTADLTQIARGPFQACYLGYALDRAHTGQGLMSEALSLLTEYAFKDLALHRIMANYLPHNAKSARLLSRLGFTVEGLAKRYLFIGDDWQDHVLSSLTSPLPCRPS